MEICNATDFESISLKKEVEIVKKLGANVQHFHSMKCDRRLDDKKFFFKTNLAKVKNQDRLKEYLPLAHKRDIRIIIYFNVHWYTKEFGRKHPDWLQIKEDGTPIDDVYTTGTSFCVNSAWREWVFQILKDLVKYEIDGIFYDGPIFFASTCYCKECQRLFKERVGERMPPKSNRQHPLWKDLINFQADSITRFLLDSNAVIKEVNPEIRKT